MDKIALMTYGLLDPMHLVAAFFLTISIACQIKIKRIVEHRFADVCAQNIWSMARKYKKYENHFARDLNWQRETNLFVDQTVNPRFSFIERYVLKRNQARWVTKHLTDNIRSLAPNDFSVCIPSCVRKSAQNGFAKIRHSLFSYSCQICTVPKHSYLGPAEKKRQMVSRLPLMETTKNQIYD